MPCTDVESAALPLHMLLSVTQAVPWHAAQNLASMQRQPAVNANMCTGSVPGQHTYDMNRMSRGHRSVSSPSYLLNGEYTSCRGWAVAVTQVLLYAAPLSTLYKALKARSSASFHLGMAILGFLSSAMWTIYGGVCLTTD